ncbi:hypothetical protein MPSEU_000710100 [Mayamaea pseudoterrestris]|nr:hypothetical protein MPSEU_000710100 [Mayamaea pseudoterrestris]
MVCLAGVSGDGNVTGEKKPWIHPDYTKILPTLLFRLRYKIVCLVGLSRDGNVTGENISPVSAHRCLDFQMPLHQAMDKPKVFKNGANIIFQVRYKMLCLAGVSGDAM